jgi:hypothetical protein
MTMSHLNGYHRKTLASLFRHPTSHNVEWHDVLSLLQHIGTVTERHSGDFEIAFGAHANILDRPRGHDLDGDALRSLRHFLAAAGLSPNKDSSTAPTPAPTATEAATCIVLIDHHHAKIFPACHRHTAAIEPIIVKPADADGSHRRVTHRQGDGDHDGGHSSEDTAYYERITADLGPATRIVVLSDGKGRSNAGDQFVDHLKHLHGEVAHRIVATDRIDILRLSDGEIVDAGLALVPS